MEGLISTGPTQSSFLNTGPNIKLKWVTAAKGGGGGGEGTKKKEVNLLP